MNIEQIPQEEVVKAINLIGDAFQDNNISDLAGAIAMLSLLKVLKDGGLDVEGINKTIFWRKKQ